MDRKADLILFNANVLTMDMANPRADLVAIRGSRIIGVGGNKDIEVFRGSRTRLIDCKGKTVIPGFHDAHLHLFGLVSGLLSLNCGPSNVSSIADIQRRIASKAAHLPKGTWLRGSNYNEFALKEKRHPNRRDLDQVAPDHPVKLTHRTGHASVLNSLALALAGINRETSDPEAGLIDRDPETGEPTGLLFGMNAFLHRQVVPPWPAEEMDRGIRQANDILLASGITSVDDATSTNGVAEWEQLERLKRTATLKPRITMMPGFDSLGEFRKKGTAALGDDHLRIGPVKIVINEIRGPLDPPQENLNHMVIEAQNAGFPVALHAIEATTVEAALNAIEYARKMSPGTDLRHRIEHCSECPPDLVQRLKKSGAIVVTQPTFIYWSGDRYLSEVEPHKIPWLYRLGTFEKSGIRIVASSDAPVTPPNPLLGIYAAVTRKSESGQLVNADEAISAEQALYAHTAGGAFASSQEHSQGSITPGKLADLVILSADPTQMPAETLKEIVVEKTIIGGEIVWERG